MLVWHYEWHLAYKNTAAAIFKDIDRGTWQNGREPAISEEPKIHVKSICVQITDVTDLYVNILDNSLTRYITVSDHFSK